MKQCIVYYWENYAPVINWIRVRSLLSTASIHEFPSRLIELVLDFLQYYLDPDVLMGIPL